MKTRYSIIALVQSILFSKHFYSHCRRENIFEFIVKRLHYEF